MRAVGVGEIAANAFALRDGKSLAVHDVVVVSTTASIASSGRSSLALLHTLTHPFAFESQGGVSHFAE